MGNIKGAKKGIRRTVQKICGTCEKEFTVAFCYRFTAKFCSRNCNPYQFGKDKSKPNRDGRKKGFTVSNETKEKISQVAKARGFGKWMKGKKLSQETKQRMSAAKQGIKSSCWKGGKWKDIDGYIYIHSPLHPNKNKDKCVFEHRLIMEKYLKRYLLPSEVVHHINNIKDDNRIENLKLFSNHSEHMKNHYPKGIQIDINNII